MAGVVRNHAKASLLAGYGIGVTRVLDRLSCWRVPGFDQVAENLSIEASVVQAGTWVGFAANGGDQLIASTMVKASRARTAGPLCPALRSFVSRTR